MSTNYYFVNKESRKETEEFNESLSNLFERFSYQLKQLGVEDILNIQLEKWMYEKQEHRIHIGKRSMGWRPLFEVCEHYESVRGMKEWYEINKDDYIIEDEYMNELSWFEFEKELISWNGRNTHFGCRPGYTYMSYFLDKDGYEWTRSEFS